MKFKRIDDNGIGEVIAEGIIIKTVEDGVDLLGNAYYQGFDKIILNADNITPEFFDLKTRLAGEVLQKFSNYRIRLAIIGDFKDVESKSLRDFIRESNKGKAINFLASKEEAISKLSV